MNTQIVNILNTIKATILGLCCCSQIKPIIHIIKQIDNNKARINFFIVLKI